MAVREEAPLLMTPMAIEDNLRSLHFEELFYSASNTENPWSWENPYPQMDLKHFEGLYGEASGLPLDPEEVRKGRSLEWQELHDFNVHRPRKRAGFKGKVVATQATLELATLILLDGARIAPDGARRTRPQGQERQPSPVTGPLPLPEIVIPVREAPEARSAGREHLGRG